jgi:hypothetical protein
MVCFESNISILAGSEKDMQNSRNTIEKIFQESNMKTNKQITKVLVRGSVKSVAEDILKGERLEHVESFSDLGRAITLMGEECKDQVLNCTSEESIHG